MRDNKPAQNPENNCSTAQLAEQELDRVVGGYIGETEKNLRPIREAGFR
jgi:hypothetical protein